MLKLALRYGAFMFVGFVAFFFLMHLFGLSDSTNLRYVNAVIHLGILWWALRAWVQEQPSRFDHYSEAVAFGVTTTSIGVGAFAIFLMLFLSANPELMNSIKAQSPRVMADYLNPVMSGVFTFGEGIIAALIGSYILVRIIEARYYRSV